MDFAPEPVLYDENGNLSQVLDPRPVRRPYCVDISGDFIIWRQYPASALRSSLKDYIAWDYLPSPRSQFANPSGDLLASFIKLGSSDDSDSLLTFAQKWGVLGICKHNYPYTHNQPAGQIEVCYPLGWDEQYGWISEFREPLSAWKFYSRQAGAILSMITKVNQGSGPSERDLAIATDPLNSDYDLLPDKPSNEDASVSKFIIADYVNRWLQLGNVHLSTSWLKRSPAVHLDYNNRLFGALAVQLMMAFYRQGFVVCSSCGKTYNRKGRRPKNGQRNYCPRCQHRSHADRQRDYRQRKRLNGIT